MSNLKDYSAEGFVLPGKRRSLRRVSPRKAKVIAETGPVRADLRARYPFCGIASPVCTTYTEGLHERRKQSAGGSLVKPANLVPACNPCNSWVEDNPTEARSLGLAVRSGDTEWDELGA